ncbi:Organic hydroperoxide resistance protein [Actinokineospora spheciospongiae]|uniref:Organic hydroperoxide resistance protein n=1 Tax=Actinokineospora spheciospongiae TaxID=909613 RepID=W7IMK2_9PSEU|nr:organic hydroperoxide resistance protein [Actinokineospora spheciospongiae]EWC61568.1 Organic hydroperoxide resistance protein [Actinokineospora spheciospongiae]PWW62703.1 Ohr subfamily peroxiredoxin [Actinokineospora spheciospongiae]
MKALYEAQATATGDGRGGHVRSSDGVVDTDLSVPKGLGGPGGDKTNPEQLFAAGYAACFHGALQVVARQAKQKIDGSQVAAKVGIGSLDTGGFGLEVALEVTIPGLDRDTAQDLVEKAHQVCPYSNATRGNIDVQLTVA